MCGSRAGSGKTRVLTQRIVDMIKGEVDPQGILAFTFTKKAADEMRDRLEKEIGEEVLSQCFVGTIHSLFFKVIKEHLPKIKPDHFGHGIVIAKDWQQKNISQRYIRKTDSILRAWTRLWHRG